MLIIDLSISQTLSWMIPKRWILQMQNRCNFLSSEVRDYLT